MNYFRLLSIIFNYIQLYSIIFNYIQLYSIIFNYIQLFWNYVKFTIFLFLILKSYINITTKNSEKCVIIVIYDPSVGQPPRDAMYVTDTDVLEYSTHVLSCFLDLPAP